MNTMMELSDSELDAVSGGANGVGNAFGNVIGVAAGVGVDTVSVLDNNTVTLNLLDGSHFNVPIGVAVAVLGTSANFIRGNA
jgi:hypothetical protein